VKCPSVEVVIRYNDDTVRKNRTWVRQLLVYVPLAKSVK
jgi:hypothetical protein